MKITKISHDFTPVHRGILFEVDTESSTASDLIVEVLNAEEGVVVATQQLRGVTCATVNIAPYISRFAQYKPMLHPYTTFVEAESAVYAVRVGSTTSEPVIISTNTEDIAKCATITAMPTTRHIAYGESDELFIMADKDAPIIAEISADNGEVLSLEHSVKSGPVRLSISTKDFGAGINNLNIRLSQNGTLFDQIDYTITSAVKRGARLAWVSGVGSIERYTFPVQHKVVRKVEKQGYNTSEGRFAATISAQNIISLISRYEPRQTIEALTQIISSPKVWIEQEDLFNEVEVRTLNVEHNLFKEPSMVTLEICEWQKEVSL